MGKTQKPAHKTEFCARPSTKQVCALVTKEMTIGEVLKKFPKTSSLFADYGLYCLDCPSATAETLEQAAAAHNFDLKKFLQDLNLAANPVRNKPPQAASGRAKGGADF